MAFSPACAKDAFHLLGARSTHGHARAVVESDVKALDVVYGLSAEQAMDAATIVANHAAQCAARVRCRVGRICQVMFLRRIAKPVENNAGLHNGDLRIGVDRSKPVHVAREVKHDGDVGALS